MRRFITTRCCYRPPPAEYVQALREPFVDPDLYLVAARWVQDNPAPKYRCVYCNELLTKCPVQAFHFTSIIDALGQEMDAPPAPSSGTRPWSDDFFDRYLLF